MYYVSTQFRCNYSQITSYDTKRRTGMRSTKAGKIVATVVMTGMLSGFGGVARAGESAPMTPELAAKKEMVRKQQGQRLTDDKRKAAAEALKAERLKILKAKEAANQSAPAAAEEK
jgi:hypothetical protein